jgi:hypothetical protein
MSTLKTLHKTSLEQLPPHNLEAEYHVLGSVLLDNSVIDREIKPKLPVNNLYREHHRKVLQAMLALHEHGTPIDLLTLRVQLDAQGQLDDVGGPAFLAALVDQVPTAANVSYHIDIINNLALQRQLLEGCINTAVQLYQANGDPFEEIAIPFQQQVNAVCQQCQSPYSWVLTEHGNAKDINYDAYLTALHDYGYRIYETGKSLMFAKLEDAIVSECTMAWGVNMTVKRELKALTQDRKDVWNFLNRKGAKYFSPNTLSSLETIYPAEFNRDDQQTCWLYYQNGAIRIHQSEGVQFVPYAELDGYVWEYSVVKRNYYGQYAGEESKRVDSKPAIAKQMIDRVAMQTIEDEYGKITEIDNRPIFYYGMAYGLHQWYDPAFPRAIIIIDNNPQIGFNEGRRGKGLLTEIWRRLRSSDPIDGDVVSEDGKSFDGRFKFQRLTPHTKILIIEDIDENVPFDVFYSAITEGVIMEGKGQAKFAFSKENTPKITFTMNKPNFDESRSSMERILLLPIGDYFAHHPPLKEFGHRLFYDWDDAEWARFDDFWIETVLDYLNTDPEAIETDMRIFNAHKLLLSTPEAMADFLDTLKLGYDHDYGRVYQHMKDLSAVKSKHEFTRLLKTYCKLRNLVLKTNSKDGRYKKNGVQYLHFTYNKESRKNPYDDPYCRIVEFDLVELFDKKSSSEEIVF